MIQRVGQTLIKDYLAYHAGDGCGLQFKAKHIDKTYPDNPNKKMKLGHYVEFLVLGTVPEYLAKQGKKPQPEYMVTPMKAFMAGTKKELKVEDMTDDYREAHRKADIATQALNEMGITIVGKNEEFENEWGRGRTDVRVTGGIFGKEVVVLDMKYTGLIDDKWSRYGFLFELEQQREHHGFQAKQYHLLTGERFFYFLVSSSKTDDTVKLIEADFTSEGLVKHRELAIWVRDKINVEETIGFVARPELTRCNECELKNSCKLRTKIPTIQKVLF